jgi:uncharacterized membrane protein HdeD (DUF308 family)
MLPAKISPIVALIAGILILIRPKLGMYIVGIYLIVTGILGLGLIH